VCVWWIRARGEGGLGCVEGGVGGRKRGGGGGSSWVIEWGRRVVVSWTSCSWGVGVVFRGGEGVDRVVGVRRVALRGGGLGSGGKGGGGGGGVGLTVVRGGRAWLDGEARLGEEGGGWAGAGAEGVIGVGRRGLWGGGEAFWLGQ